MNRYRHSSKTTVQFDLTLEEAVAEYQRQTVYFRDYDTAKWYFNFVKNSVKTVFQNRRITWNQQAEDFLKACIMQYDTYSGMPFQAFLVGCMEREYNLKELKQDKAAYIYSEAVQGNSSRKFLETWTSKPEQLNMDKMPKTKERKISE